jgi:hypothetical protein
LQQQRNDLIGIATFMLGQAADRPLDDDLRRLIDFQLQAAVGEGMLTRTDDGYEMTMRLQDRAVFFNDRELFRFRPDEPADTEETFEETDEEG